MENKNYAIPLAIVVVGIIIAGSFFLSGDRSSLAGLGGINNPQGASLDPLDNLRRISTNDWIKGNIDAQIVIIEYSDIECPFCKVFHNTLKEVVANYQPNEVAWIFRHFPLDSLHENARLEAEATQCVGLLGGNDKFWEYLSLLFETTTSNDGLDITKLPAMAEAIGLETSALADCLKTETTKQAVEEDFQNAVDVGATGTPFAVIYEPSSGTKVAIPGAVPADILKGFIDEVLTEGLLID